MSKKTIVPIVFITDENYVVPTCTAIVSLLANRSPNTFYEVSIIGLKLSARSLTVLNSLSIIGARVKVIPLTTNKYIKHKSIWPGFHVNSTAMYKYDLPNIFPKYKKVLYIDSDTIIQKDLAELFNIDLADKYAAVVKDMKGMLVNHYEKKWSLQNYFNSGVMLLDLQKMRKDGIFAKMMSLLAKRRKKLTFMDQDIFNLAFEEKIKFISPKYNYMVSNKLFSLKKIAKFFDITLETGKRIYQRPTIIHYTATRKPWAHYFAPHAKEWVRYFKLSPYKNTRIKRRFFTNRDLLLVQRIIYKYKELPRPCKTLSK